MTSDFERTIAALCDGAVDQVLGVVAVHRFGPNGQHEHIRVPQQRVGTLRVAELFENRRVPLDQQHHLLSEPGQSGVEQLP